MSTKQSPTGRRKPARHIVLVAACSQRKRLPAPPDLALSSVTGSADDRIHEWRRRLARVSAPRSKALNLYAGDHWHSILDAYVAASSFSSRVDLWILSAGYGLIPGDKAIKPYSATFTARTPDSVWRGPSDGTRQERLQAWWRTLNHQTTLGELLPSRNGSLIVVAGAAYFTAIETDVQELVSDGSEALSIISAGTPGNGALLPVSGRLRAAVGGTDSALNARTLRYLARSVDEHQFERERMAKTLTDLARRTKPTIRRRGRSTTDAVIAKTIRSFRHRQPGISRTQALRELRASDIACEQDRFATIWWATVKPRR